MKHKVIYILLVIALIVLLALLGFWKFYLKTATNVSYLSPQKFASYPDEPVVGTNKTYRISSSSWNMPKKPDIINADKSNSRIPNSSLAQVWKDSALPSLNKDLTGLHSSQKYYSYFYQNGLFPTDYGTGILTGDGKSSVWFISTAADCGACEQNYITIFVNNKTYTTITTFASVKPRADGKGFYLTSIVADQEPIHTVFITRFQWNGNGFEDVGEKTVKMGKK